MNLFYREVGNGRPFVILHGLLGCSDYWLPVTKYFLNKYQFKFIIPDLRNHGQSEKSENFSIDDLAEDIIDLIKNYNTEDIIILGHSLGGKIIYNLISKFNLKFNSIIIVDISNKNYQQKYDFENLLNFISNIDLSKFNNRQDIDIYLEKSNLKIDDKQIINKNITQKNRQYIWKINPQAIKNNYKEILKKNEFDEKISTPTLLLKGENSDYISKEDIELMKKNFTNLTFTEVSNSGHWIHTDNFEEFCFKIEEFINNQKLLV